MYCKLEESLVEKQQKKFLQHCWVLFLFCLLTLCVLLKFKLLTIEGLRIQQIWCTSYLCLLVTQCVFLLLLVLMFTVHFFESYKS